MPAKKYWPERGDIVWTDFDPAGGHEQMGKRPALVLSPTAFNRKIRLALVAPITSRVRGHGFEVPLHGTPVLVGLQLRSAKRTNNLNRSGKTWTSP